MLFSSVEILFFSPKRSTIFSIKADGWTLLEVREGVQKMKPIQFILQIQGVTIKNRISKKGLSKYNFMILKLVSFCKDTRKVEIKPLLISRCHWTQHAEHKDC